MSRDLHWFESTHSTDEGERVEVATSWIKSSYSGEEGECVEVAACPSTIHVRDSKNPQGPQLTVAPGAWSSFLTRLTDADGCALRRGRG